MLNGLLPYVALAAGLVVALLAYLGLGLRGRRKLEARVGLAALDTMKWREFAHLVNELMRSRGLTPIRAESSFGDAGFDLKFERGNQRYLVLIKHGGTTRVGASTLRDLRAAISTEGAGGGVVVSTGTVDRDARVARSDITIEILHGEALWKELSRQLPEDLATAARARIRIQFGMRWLAVAALTALAATSVLLALRPPAPAPTAIRSPAPATAPAPAAAPAADAEEMPQPPAPAPAPVTSTVRQVPVLTEAEAEARRALALAAVQALDGVEDASWSTRSTLVVALAPVDPEMRRVVSDRVCERLVEYEELRYTRLQLQEGPDRVRWAQCQ